MVERFICQEFTIEYKDLLFARFYLTLLLTKSILHYGIDVVYQTSSCCASSSCGRPIRQQRHLSWYERLLTYGAVSCCVNTRDFNILIMSRSDIISRQSLDTYQVFLRISSSHSNVHVFA